MERRECALHDWISMLALGEGECSQAASGVGEVRRRLGEAIIAVAVPEPAVAAVTRGR